MEEDNIATLRAGLAGFFDQLAAFDWRLLQVTVESGCSNLGVLDPGAADPVTAFADSAFGWAVPDAVTEALLALARLALDQAAPGGCNAGGLRIGSHLQVITVSDEPEGSGTSADDHVAALRELVAAPGLLRISAVADLSGACGLAPGGGPGGYLEAAQATGGALIDICDPDWGDALPALLDGGSTLGAPVYQLSEDPLPGTLEVRVNGEVASEVDQPDGSRELAIVAPAVAPGDEIAVTYAVAAECR